MAPSPIVAATLQTALLGATSNILAQAITAYKHDEALSIDWMPVFQFLVFMVVSTPPNFLWQEFIESAFPAYPEEQKQRQQKDRAPKSPNTSSSSSSSSSPSKPRLSVTNTIVKFLLDQTLAAAVNTLLFSTFNRSLRAAMHPCPRITGLLAAARYWSRPGAIDFARVDFAAVLDASLAEFWPFLLAGARFWPLVALVNYALVKSVQARNLVGSLAGLAWGVYVCMFMVG